ncbi:hypothetical protein [Shinella zoogloeoides]|uniref:hypothetical protein n=1 Tax=Shinella zoogloeoides TaxID=352475 RepID=UPI00299EB5AE|nr:hypothetical protein [Shinella zoogloeoides]
MILDMTPHCHFARQQLRIVVHASSFHAAAANPWRSLTALFRITSRVTDVLTPSCFSGILVGRLIQMLIRHLLGVLERSCSRHVMAGRWKPALRQLDEKMSTIRLRHSTSGIMIDRSH